MLQAATGLYPRCNHPVIDNGGGLWYDVVIKQRRSQMPSRLCQECYSDYGVAQDPDGVYRCEDCAEEGE